MSSKSDKELGIVAGITRRDFLNASLLGTGAMLLEMSAPAKLMTKDVDFDGPGGVGDYARSNGNTKAVLQVGHDLRDGRYNSLSARTVDTGELYDLIVVGGGISGLAAAFEFKKNKATSQKCLIIENHLIVGGEAKQNEFIVDGQRLIGPQGSNGTHVPRLDPPVLSAIDRGIDYYEMVLAMQDACKDLGMPREYEFHSWDPRLKQLQFARDNYEFYLWNDQSPSIGYFFENHGWVRDIWTDNLRGTPYSKKVQKDLITWRTSRTRYYQGSNFQQWLDSMSYRNYIEKVMALDPEVTKYADPILASSIGGGCDISALSAFRLRMPGFLGFAAAPAPNQETGMTDMGDNIEKTSVFSFPGGNSAIARYYIKGLIPESIAGQHTLNDVINGRVQFNQLDHAGNDVRMRLGSTVVAVSHEGPGISKSQRVSVSYVKAGHVYRVKVRAIVMAGGSWITRHAVTDLPDEYRTAYQQFYRAPMLVVNVALSNWRFMYNLGITACRWFEGFGFTCNIRKPMTVGSYQPPLHPDKPTLLTFYVPFCYPGLPFEQQGLTGRYEMLATSYIDYERKIRKQMVNLFGGADFNPQRDIAGIILNRWGHAYVAAQPGFYFGKEGRPAPRDIVRKGFGRISFANAELMGTQHWPGAVAEGRRATRQALQVL